MDRSKVIFGNQMPKKVIQKAEKSKKKYQKKYGDDSAADYPVVIEDNVYLYDLLGIKNIQLNPNRRSAVSVSHDVNGSQGGRHPSGQEFDREKGIIVGNIRMGFGHYRISIAIASAAHALGYTPYWMDLNSYPHTTCSKVIGAQNNLYSLGSRISQKSWLFNKFVWEPMNYEGFRQLSYNASDQKNAELMAPVYKNVPKDIPVVATHVWPAQAAVHAGMKHVVNAIPDNWPMALHYAEGSVHTVQTYYAYQGYRIGNGMLKKKVVRPMPADALLYTGHYIDHELVVNLEDDCAARVARVNEGKPMRFLLTIGGAGAQKEIFAAVIRYLLPFVRKKKAAVYVNVGDYKNVWEELKQELPGMKESATGHMDNWKDTLKFAEEALTGEVEGIHGFYHKNIFEAVYCTNLLMRSADVLVTKPSELAFYPIPKLFIRRVGGHEQWGAVHSAEIGDGTLECRDVPHTLQMLELFLMDKGFLSDMCDNILQNKKQGIYDGAYQVVKTAMRLKK